jgi:putative redox protein
MAELAVRHLEGDRFEVEVRGHTLVVDQPRRDGGGDAGPTPTELFVASLAACVGFYAERFLVRHGLPVKGLAVSCGFRMSEDRPARVEGIDLRVRLPYAFPAVRRAALLAVVEHCTVHNSIRQAPRVAIGLDIEEAAA